MSLSIGGSTGSYPKPPGSVASATCSATTAQLKFEARIGVGSRGQVFRARCANGKAVAVKVMNREDDETAVEVRALRRLQPHAHVISLEGEVEYSADNAFVILEFAETDLLELIMDAHRLTGRGLSEDIAARYFSQLSSALGHTHRRGIYHLDIKPENCLIVNGVLKLCDFGSASFRRHTNKASGSVYYAAPEVLPLFYTHTSATPVAPGAHALSHGVDGLRADDTYDAAAADVWSLGVVLFAMLAGRPPWSEASYYDSEFVSLVRGSFEYPDYFPQPVVRLLRSMLQLQPKQRVSVSDILRDAWVTPFRAAERDMAELRRSMMKHLRFIDAPTASPSNKDPSEVRRRRRHHHRKHHHRRHRRDREDAAYEPREHHRRSRHRDHVAAESPERSPSGSGSPADARSRRAEPSGSTDEASMSSPAASPTAVHLRSLQQSNLPTSLQPHLGNGHVLLAHLSPTPSSTPVGAWPSSSPGVPSTQAPSDAAPETGLRIRVDTPERLPEPCMQEPMTLDDIGAQGHADPSGAGSGGLRSFASDSTSVPRGHPGALSVTAADAPAQSAPPALGLKISIAATRQVTTDHEDIMEDNTERFSGTAVPNVLLPSGLSIVLSHSSGPTSSSVHGVSPVAAGGTPVTLRSAGTHGTSHGSLPGSAPGLRAGESSSTLDSSSHARSRHSRVDRGAMTPGINLTRRPNASPATSPHATSPLKRSNSADVGMMAAMLRTNTERAVTEVPLNAELAERDESTSERSGEGEEDDVSSTTSSSGSRGSMSTGSSASSASRGAPDEPGPHGQKTSDLPQPPAMQAAAFGIQPLTLRPKEDAVVPPPLPGLRLGLGRGPESSASTGPSGASSAPLSLSGLSIRGHMSVSATPAEPMDQDEEGLPPEAVGYGSKFAARRLQQMQAVEAALQAGASLDALMPPAPYHGPPADDDMSPAVGSPMVMSPPAPGVAPVLRIQPESAAAPAPAAAAPAPPPPIALATGRYIPPSALAAIANAQYTAHGFPPPIRAPANPFPDLASAPASSQDSARSLASAERFSLASGQASPLPQLRRVTAIAMPTNSPRVRGDSPRVVGAQQARTAGTSALGPPLAVHATAGARAAQSAQVRTIATATADVAPVTTGKGALAFVAAESLLDPEETDDGGPLFSFAGGAEPGGDETSSRSASGSESTSPRSSASLPTSGDVSVAGPGTADAELGGATAPHTGAQLRGFHLARISSAARRAVEEHQTALGIGEGFELPSVHLLSRRGADRRALVAASSEASDIDAFGDRGSDYTDAGDSGTEHDAFSRSYSRASSSWCSDSEYTTDADDGTSVGDRSSIFDSEADSDGSARGSARADPFGFVPLLRGSRRPRRRDEGMLVPAGNEWARGRENLARLPDMPGGSLLHADDDDLDAGHHLWADDAAVQPPRDTVDMRAFANATVLAPPHAALRQSTGSSVAELQEAFQGFAISSTPSDVVLSSACAHDPDASWHGVGHSQRLSLHESPKMIGGADESPSGTGGHKRGRSQAEQVVPERHGMRSPSNSSSLRGTPSSLRGLRRYRSQGHTAHSSNELISPVDVTDIDPHAHRAESVHGGGVPGYEVESAIDEDVGVRPLRISKPASAYASSDDEDVMAAGGGPYTSTGLTTLSSFSGGVSSRVSESRRSSTQSTAEDGGTPVTSPVHSRPRMMAPGAKTPYVPTSVADLIPSIPAASSGHSASSSSSRA